LEPNETIRWPKNTKARIDVIATFVVFEFAAVLALFADIKIFAPVIAFFGPLGVWETARYHARRWKSN
jgi:hypothetical protein